ncbi:Crp/Fnr family transcriptional regulator [bacterium]|nr:Crp/Fnr family transcriptional regulator [bacterium]
MKTKSEPSELICSTCPVMPDTMFTVCDLKALDSGLKNKTVEKFEKNAVMFHEGDEPRGVFCVYSGVIKITRKDVKGVERILQFAKPGDLLGIPATVTRQPYHNSAHVLEASSVCYIAKEDFINFMKSNPEFSLRVMKFLSDRIDFMEKKIKFAAETSLPGRLADMLLMLKQAYGLNDQDELNVSIATDDLANFVNADPGALIVQLKKMSDDKILAIRNNRIQFLSVEKMEELIRP